MNFSKDQTIAFFTEKKGPNTWQIGNFEKEIDSHFCLLLHQGKPVTTLKQYVRNLEESSPDKIQEFGSTQFDNLLFHLKKAIKYFSLQKSLGEIRFDGNTISFIDHSITIHPDYMLRLSISGIVKQIPCWNVNQWKNGNQITLGLSPNNLKTVQILISEFRQSQHDDYFYHVNHANPTCYKYLHSLNY
jgi:hypothetical protein